MAPKRVYYMVRDSNGRTRRMTGRGALALARRERVTVYRPKPVGAADRIVRVAERELGTMEVPQGSNSGPRVKVYQHSTTVPGTGWPWCQAFVRYVLDEANVLESGYRGAYVPHQVQWAVAAGRFRRSPKRGCLVFFDWDRDGLADHVGIVTKVTDSGIVTIEGNTQPGLTGDQSNGDGVYERRDRRSQVILGYMKTD